ncbi:MAG: hypothetical protein SO314_08300, partial [Alphaproteobacteria bacterium]|nr:hypothetical protein [Alphaproteobacteria bacterium]
NPKYHLVPGFPKCTKPKIYDKTCPHSDDWITECYCPASYNQICTSPYRGVGLICDGKYESCCDTRCSEGSQSSCSYPYVLDHTSSTGCGETCYVCRYGNDCNTSCSSNENAISSGGTNDFNGQTCVTCSAKCTPLSSETGCDCTQSCSDGCGGTRTCCTACSEPEPEVPSCTDTCSSKGYKSSQPSGQTCSTTTVCGTTCYYNCTPNEPSTPSCTDTCSSKGYKSSQPSGQTCSTTTVCGTTCYKDCKPSCTLPDCTNTVSSKPSNSSYTTTSCTDCSGKHTINTGWSCNSGYTEQGGSCVKKCTDTCSSKGYKSSQPSGQTCSTTTVCESTCYYNCKFNDPCAGVTCSGGKTCSNGTCVCPSGTKDCGGSCKNCCSDSDCGSGYTCNNGSCEKKTEIDCSWCDIYTGVCKSKCVSACKANRSFDGKVNGLTCAIR